MSLRRFVIAWTALAFVVWLLAVSGFESDDDCTAPTAGYVCIDTHDALIAGTLVVGVPWLVALLVAGGVAGIARRRRKLDTD